MTEMLAIRVDDLTGEPTQELLRLHAQGMEAASPPGACHYFAGHGAAFDAAIGLYHSAGFVPCAPFADYVESEFSRYFTRLL